MNKEVIDEVFNHLDAIADKLGVGIQHIWPWFMKQVYVEACVYIPLAFIMSFVMYKASMYFCAHYKPNDPEVYNIYRNDHEFSWGLFLILWAVLTLIADIACVNSVVAVLNPEYAAFKSILSIK